MLRRPIETTALIGQAESLVRHLSRYATNQDLRQLFVFIVRLG